MKITTIIQFEGQEYRFEGLRLAEARLVKQVCALSPQEFTQALFDNDPDAVTAAVMILRRRAGETSLRFSDVDGDLSTYSIELRDEKDREITVKLDEDGEPVMVNGKPVMLFDGIEDAPDPTEPAAPPAPELRSA